MVEIVITESAYADLDAIEDYIALDSSRYARLWVEKNSYTYKTATGFSLIW